MGTDSEITLPNIICLEEFGGNWNEYCDYLYDIFVEDFINNRPIFRGTRLGIKKHPSVDGKVYTFYHMTHSGNIETERTPDLRRCERIVWGKPVIENGDAWKLRIWEQDRGGKDRICIWLSFENDEPDYIVILDDRKTFILPWTAFTLEYRHEKRKKLKEYEAYLKGKSRSV